MMIWGRLEKGVGGCTPRGGICPHPLRPGGGLGVSGKGELEGFTPGNPVCRVPHTPMGDAPPDQHRNKWEVRGRGTARVQYISQATDTMPATELARWPAGVPDKPAPPFVSEVPTGLGSPPSTPTQSCAATRTPLLDFSLNANIIPVCYRGYPLRRPWRRRGLLSRSACKWPRTLRLIAPPPFPTLPSCILSVSFSFFLFSFPQPDPHMPLAPRANRATFRGGCVSGAGGASSDHAPP